MKRVLFSVLMVGAFATSYAQNNKVVSAYNYMKYDDELDKAKEAIDAASVHEQTSQKAKTWMYRGHVYSKLADSETFKTLHENPLQVAVESYLKAYTFDTKRIEMNDLNQGLASTLGRITNQGIQDFNAKNYVRAAQSFDSAIEGYKKFNVTDSLSYFYGAVAYKQIENTETAVNYFNKCIEIGFEGAQAYNYLTDIYSKAGNTEMYNKTVQEGRAKYPEDDGLLTAEINIALLGDDINKALENLKQAIAKSPDNSTLYYARGNMYEKLGNQKGDAGDAEGATANFDLAKADYVKAIEIDPNSFDANYNMGALIFNRAVKMMDLINQIKDNAKYSEEKKKADAIFLTSIPYLEKAHELDPADLSTMQSLKQLYVRSGNTEKYNAIKAELEN
ncbi:MAG: tetratricopeptide repeat protein [Flavobacteriales bacterium]|nr:tetratricopeptide repeat protein [Flavobacteriales bacterium]